MYAENKIQSWKVRQIGWNRCIACTRRWHWFWFWIITSIAFEKSISEIVYNELSYIFWKSLIINYFNPIQHLIKHAICNWNLRRYSLFFQSNNQAAMPNFLRLSQNRLPHYKSHDKPNHLSSHTSFKRLESCLAEWTLQPYHTFSEAAFSYAKLLPIWSRQRL